MDEGGGGDVSRIFRHLCHAKGEGGGETRETREGGERQRMSACRVAARPPPTPELRSAKTQRVRLSLTNQKEDPTEHAIIMPQY